MSELKTSDVDDLHDGLLSKINDTYQKTEGFPLWDMLKACAYSLKDLWDRVFTIEWKLDVDNLTGDELEKFIYQRKGLSRKAATKAIGSITIVTGSGTVKAGDLFESTTGGIQFQATESKIVTAGSTVAIEAVAAGDSGNLPANSITLMPVTLTGISQITNSASTYDGYDAESDDSLRERYYDALQIPATSGNIYHYRLWARECSGVGDAQVIPLWDGDNTVKVVIVDDNNQPANDVLVATVQEYIDPNKEGKGAGTAPIGAYCTVVSASQLSVNISFSIKINSSYNEAAVKSNVTNAIKNYVNSIGFDSTYVSYAKIGDAIVHIAGVDDYDSLTINGSATRLEIPQYYVPVLGGVSYV